MSFCFSYKKIDLIYKDTNNKDKIIKKYRKKLKDNYIPVENEKITFVNKNSVSDDKLLFTNKLQRRKSPRNKAIKEFIIDVQKNPNLLEHYFYGNEIESITEYDKHKLERLDGIFRLYDNLPENFVMKYAPNERYFQKYNLSNRERGFELLFTNENGDIKVYLVDLYHMAIPSKNNNQKQEYINKMDYKIDMLDCIFNIENDEELAKN